MSACKKLVKVIFGKLEWSTRLPGSPLVKECEG